MEINNIQVNSYGNLKDLNVEFKNGINLIYGKNESGKSTLINFIINSFYGISKNKKGKNYSNYEKYYPWNGEEFSGKIKYKLDNNEEFEVFRDFNKKNPKIFNNKKEEISKRFNIDKNKGNEFFYEQTKIDEELFLSTLAINQEEVKLEKSSQNILIQKIANLVGTGDDSVSYKRAIDRINRRQLDEIGTERSREKPINKIEKNIKKLEEEKQNLEKYKNYKYEIEEDENNLIDNILILENENNFLNDLKLIIENQKIENEKIKIKEKIKNENLEIIKNKNKKINNIKNNLENNLENKKENNKKIKLKKKKINFMMFCILIILILINIIQKKYINNIIFNYFSFLTVPSFLIFWIIFIKNKNNKIINNEKIEKNNSEKINMEINNIKNEINILENNNNNLEKEINKIKNNNNLKLNFEKEKIKNNYLNKIEKNKINNIINLNDAEKINLEIKNTQKIINDKKLKLHSLKIDKKNIEPKLDNLSKIEEELIYNNEKKINLINLNNSINLAKQVLEQAYEEMKNTVTPKFTDNLSKIMRNITDGKYNDVNYNESTGLVVQIENGDIIPGDKLSLGTLDQLFLSLRLSMLEELSKEKVPILLDEVFAFYDDFRLENVLNFLNNNYADRQIIIFSCTKREKEIMEKDKIDFNYIELSV